MEGCGPVASVASVVCRRDEAGLMSRPPSSRRRRTGPCCAAKWSGGIRNYGSLKEGKSDNEFDGVTKNSIGVKRRV